MKCYIDVMLALSFFMSINSKTTVYYVIVRNRALSFAYLNGLTYNLL